MSSLDKEWPQSPAPGARPHVDGEEENEEMDLAQGLIIAVVSQEEVNYLAGSLDEINILLDNGNETYASLVI